MVTHSCDTFFILCDTFLILCDTFLILCDTFLILRDTFLILCGTFSMQELMPDALHWLGISKIDRLISMSDMKYNAITSSGIEVCMLVSLVCKHPAKLRHRGVHACLSCV
jgi:hypothetical protein